MRSLLVPFVLAATCGGLATVADQSFRSRPITMIVPFAAGGPVGTIARHFAVPKGKTRYG
jgi:tripartite-type tricarboxylate transporter receptor subunit TctC